MSVWVTLEMKVKEGAFAALQPFLEANLPRVRGFEGAKSVSLLHDDETGRFLLLEEWRSREHHESYIQFISDNGVMAELLAFMQGPPDVKYYAKLPL